MTFAVETVVNSTVMEERHSPVGCPDFKSGGRRQRVSGEFDSHLFRHFCRGPKRIDIAPQATGTCTRPPLYMSVALVVRLSRSAVTRPCYWSGRPSNGT